MNDLRQMMIAALVLALKGMPSIALFTGITYLISGPVALVPLIAAPIALSLA